MGFFAFSGSTIQNCTANDNQGDGICLVANTLARGNNCNRNALNGDGAGIQTVNVNNRIEGNNVNGNLRGIDTPSKGNLIIGNSASHNGTNSAGNYRIGIDNHYGPIIDISATGTAAANGKGPFPSTLTSTDPRANFSY